MFEKLADLVLGRANVVDQETTLTEMIAQLGYSLKHFLTCEYLLNIFKR